MKREKILYVLMDPALDESTANVYGMARNTYQKWLNDYTTIQCIMRTAMNDEFNQKFEDAEPKEMI